MTLNWHGKTKKRADAMSRRRQAHTAELRKAEKERQARDPVQQGSEWPEELGTYGPSQHYVEDPKEQR
ncbi:MAG: hypothetical protein Q8R78_07780 [Candidatus Omnitrophota bacterium]|nr:hypothetical protein [Candidatus Omnitrophota bacterium]